MGNFRIENLWDGQSVTIEEQKPEFRTCSIPQAITTEHRKISFASRACASPVSRPIDDYDGLPELVETFGLSDLFAKNTANVNVPIIFPS